MDYFLEAFGNITLGKVALFLAAVIFLVVCYKKVEKYFSEKAIREQEKDEEIKKCWNRSKCILGGDSRVLISRRS